MRFTAKLSKETAQMLMDYFLSHKERSASIKSQMQKVMDDDKIAMEAWRQVFGEVHPITPCSRQNPSASSDSN